MIWTGFKWYAKSDKGYHVAKHGHPPLIIKYIAYSPNNEIIGGCVLCFADARDLCDEHYNEKNKQTDGDIF